MDGNKESGLSDPLIPRHKHKCHYKHNKNLHRAFECNRYFSVFQLLMVLALLYSFCLQGLVSYNLYLFEMEPDYLCKYKNSDIFVECKTVDLERAVEWKHDTAHNNLNLDNWFTRLHFENIEKWKIGMIGTLYFVGYIGGSIYFPRLADIFGRKPFVIIGGFIQTLFTLLLMVSNNLIFLYVNMFMIGIASPFLASIGYNYLIELIPKEKQSMVNSLLMAFDAMGSMIGILYFTLISANMNYFILTISLLSLLATLWHLCTPESPMFSSFKKEEEIWSDSTGDQGDDLKKTSMFDFFTNSKLFVNILVMAGVWSTASACYYLINFYMKYMGGSTLKNVIANFTSELLASFVAYFIFNCLGEKKSLTLFFLISGVAGAIFCYGFSNPYIINVLILMAKFGVGAAFVTIYIATARIFPNEYSATAFGICNIFARIVTAWVPIIVEFPSPIPMGFLSVTCFLVSCSVWFLRTDQSDHSWERDN